MERLKFYWNVRKIYSTVENFKAAPKPLVSFMERAIV